MQTNCYILNYPSFKVWELLTLHIMNRHHHNIHWNTLHWLSPFYWLTFFWLVFLFFNDTQEFDRKEVLNFPWTNKLLEGAAHSWNKEQEKTFPKCSHFLFFFGILQSLYLHIYITTHSEQRRERESRTKNVQSPSPSSA